MLFPAKQAFVWRDEKRAPLKTPAWKASMYTTEKEPANKLFLCWFLNTAVRLFLVDQFISVIWQVHCLRVGT